MWRSCYWKVATSTAKLKRSFHERDKNNAKSANRGDAIPDCLRVAPFKANIIPWKVRANLYQEMVEKEEYARELRIKRNAELNLTLAKYLIEFVIIIFRQTCDSREVRTHR